MRRTGSWVQPALPASANEATTRRTGPNGDLTNVWAPRLDVIGNADTFPA